MRSYFATLALVSVGTTAAAQDAIPGFELERLTINPSGRGSLVFPTADHLGALKVRVSATAHYQKDPLVFILNDKLQGRAVSSRFGVIGALGFGITDWLEIDAQVPFILDQKSEDLTTYGIATPTKTSIGTPLVGLRGRLLSEKKSGVDLGLSLGVFLPIGDLKSLTRDAGAAYFPRLEVGRTLGQFLRFGANVGVQLRKEATLTANAETVRDQVGDTVQIAGVLSTIGRGVRMEVGGYGNISLAKTPDSGEILAGLRFPIGPVELYAIGGPGIGSAPGVPQFRVLGGLAFDTTTRTECVEGGYDNPAECPDLDFDGDRVRNGDDRCPKDKGLASMQGCMPKDTDADGVPDDLDKCPKDPGPESNSGCPMLDKDGDGVADDVDRCPMDPGPASMQGCPNADEDGDGILNTVDACPKEPGIPELKGCPEMDSDGDTVPDHLDNCKSEPGDPTNAGCPRAKKQLVRITKDRIEIAQKVFFATGKSVILAKSFNMLNQVAEVLQSHPEIEKVVIEGHTDSVGNREKNLRLSQDRADSVRDYIVGRGVDASRLSASGYGPDRPAESNKTAKGREANRRVEFRINAEGETKVERLD